MNFRSMATTLAIIVGLGVALAGCSKLNQVRAMKAFKDANKLYTKSDWKAAADKYEEAIQLDPNDQLNTCPESPGCVYFYLANSYDNMYRPTRKGEPANDEYLEKAIANYQVAAEKIKNDPKMKDLSLRYLVAAYGPEKLNDPTRAEPVVRNMIDLDPREPSNYFQLASIYENSGEYELAEQTFLKAKEAKPSDPIVYVQLAGYYSRQGIFDKIVEAANERIRVEPNNPEAYQSLAVYYWDAAYRDFRLSDKQKLDYILRGLEAVDKAIKINPDYMEAIAYKNILLRMQALHEKDPGKQKELLREADTLRNRAEELRKQRAAGVS